MSFDRVFILSTLILVLVLIQTSAGLKCYKCEGYGCGDPFFTTSQSNVTNSDSPKITTCPATYETCIVCDFFNFSKIYLSVVFFLFKLRIVLNALGTNVPNLNL